MCGIAGFVSFTEEDRRGLEEKRSCAEKMGKVLRHRGPDDFGTYAGPHFAFSHARLAVMDPVRAIQPMRKKVEGKEYVMVYNGEVYNAPELRRSLQNRGFHFETTSDTEVVLNSYCCYGEKMVAYLNGIYSFVIWNEREQTAFFCRDRMGVKPLFYTLCNGTFVFGSEIKALLQYPGIEPVVGENGMCQLFGIGPARIPGSGIYKNVYEVLPGHCGSFSESGFVQYAYWKPVAEPVTDTYEQAVEKVRYLLTDSIRRQMASDVPICTLLSGGIDSSVVSAVAAEYVREQGKCLDTYSFDYTHNQDHFVASAFQPEQDRPYVEQMVQHIGSNHCYLECAYEDLFDCLYDAVEAKDSPGMTDVDASLLYFARKIKKKHTVCLSGECADEIFGGYPWFRAEESFKINRFPWSRDLEFRKRVLKPEIRERLQLDAYVAAQYEKSVRDTALLPEEEGRQDRLFVMGEEEWKKLCSVEQKRMLHRRQRELAHLNIQWFMATLLERKDRMTMAASLEVRVPFADHRLVEYLYQLPWEHKDHNHTVKSLLKDAMASYLPKSVLTRKKCPYPKTYDPKFEQKLKQTLQEILADPSSPVLNFVDCAYLKKAMENPSDYGKPWFGQLMALPQMYAYLIQVNYWMLHYHIRVV